MHKLIHRSIYLVTVTVFLAIHPAQAGQALNAEQVHDLFSNKTVKYHHERLNFDFTVYHAPDGSLRGTREGEPMSSTMQWSVNPQGELCITYKQRTGCHPIIRENGQYRKIGIMQNGQTRVLVTYREFIDGNPNNF